MTLLLRPVILVVDDKPNMLSLLAKIFGKTARVITALGIRDAITCLEGEPIDAVLSDVRLGDGDGVELMRHVRATRPGVPIILMTAYATVSMAVQAIRDGAYDYITKPFEPDAVRELVERAIGDARVLSSSRRSEGDDGLGPLLGRTPPMRELFRLIERFAPTDATVLVLGETGTGKELVARAIHDRSARAEHPMFAVNSAAIPRGLVESELFGYAKGAFTGATTDRQGLFEAAHESTLLLDEIGELRTSVQAKLTRVLEQRAVMRVGETRERKVNVRLVAATHRDLRKMVAAGLFREDLWFRLNVCSLEVPPLRERAGDVPLLAQHFLQERAPLASTSAVSFSADALAALIGYSWPGNVRELRSVVERAAIMEDESEVQLGSLPIEIQDAAGAPATLPFVTGTDVAAGTFREALESARGEATRRYVETVLRNFHGDVAASAAHAGVERESFYRLMRRYGVVADQFRAPPSSRRGAAPKS